MTLRDPMDGSPPGSSVHRTLLARIWEWVAMPSSGDPPTSGIELASLKSPALAGWYFTTGATWEARKASEVPANALDYVSLLRV